MKNTMYKIDAIASERQGLGVPFVKLPENYTEADRSQSRGDSQKPTGQSAGVYS